jgi:hypothetical protein
LPQCPTQRSWHESDQGQCSDIRDDALTVSGALYFIKQSLWKELTDCPLYQQYCPGTEGAFLPTQHYFEETFCSYHARAHGSRVVFYGPALMTHYWHQASPYGGWQDMKFGESQQMMREACRLHGIVCE